MGRVPNNCHNLLHNHKPGLFMGGESTFVVVRIISRPLYILLDSINGYNLALDSDAIRV